MNLELIIQLLGAGGLGAALIGGWFMRRKTSAEAAKISAEAKKIDKEGELSMAKFSQEIAENLNKRLNEQRDYYETKISQLETLIKEEREFYKKEIQDLKEFFRKKEIGYNNKIKELSQQIKQLEDHAE